MKLVRDLLEYIDYNQIPLNEFQQNQLPKLKKVVGDNKSTPEFSDNLAGEVIEKFDNDFIDKQMKLMISLVDESPTDVIGKSKELVESCFKHILDDRNIPYKNSDTINSLRGKVFSYRLEGQR